jgi:DNA-binding NarL/FixJ family response regulator
MVEDHPVFAHGLSELINADARLRLCGVAKDARAALEQLARLVVDVLVVDITLGNASGMDLIKATRVEYPSMRSLVVSMHDESLYGERALRAGASGYVMKHEPAETLLDAVRAVAEGRIWLSEALSATILRKVIQRPEGTSSSPLHILSDRELEIFELIGRGRRTQEISGLLHIAVKTVESHRMNIRQKLDLKNGLELVRQAMQWVQESSAGR